MIHYKLESYRRFLIMSKCCGNNDAKFFEKPNAGICDVCHPAENKMSPIEAVAMCPPIGEPKCKLWQRY